RIRPSAAATTTATATRSATPRGFRRELTLAILVSAIDFQLVLEGGDHRLVRRPPQESVGLGASRRTDVTRIVGTELQRFFLEELILKRRPRDPQVVGEEVRRWNCGEGLELAGDAIARGIVECVVAL